jgi:hypothetical protein
LPKYPQKKCKFFYFFIWAKAKKGEAFLFKNTKNLPNPKPARHCDKKHKADEFFIVIAKQIRYKPPPITMYFWGQTLLLSGSSAVCQSAGKAEASQ